jgi:hypothetical protein
LLLLLLLLVAGPEKLWGGSHSVWRDGAHTPSPLLLFALHHYSRVPLSAQGVLAHGGLKDEWRSGGGEVYFFFSFIIFEEDMPSFHAHQVPPYPPRRAFHPLSHRLINTLGGKTEGGEHCYREWGGREG